MLHNLWFWISIVLSAVIVLLIFVLKRPYKNGGDINVVFGYDGEGWDPKKPLLYLAASEDFESFRNGEKVLVTVRIKNTL